MSAMSKKQQSVSRPTPWKQVVVLCRKCGKKLDGGFGEKGKDSLRNSLRQTLREEGRRRDVRIFETSCMGICPKRGVTALNATKPGRLHVISAGTDTATVVRTLLDADVSPSIGSVGGIHRPAARTEVETT
jgi:predicted metal-binding protein